MCHELMKRAAGLFLYDNPLLGQVLLVEHGFPSIAMFYIFGVDGLPSALRPAVGERAKVGFTGRHTYILVAVGNNGPKI